MGEEWPPHGSTWPPWESVATQFPCPACTASNCHVCPTKLVQHSRLMLVCLLSASDCQLTESLDFLLQPLHAVVTIASATTHVGGRKRDVNSNPCSKGALIATLNGAVIYLMATSVGWEYCTFRVHPRHRGVLLQVLTSNRAVCGQIMGSLAPTTRGHLRRQPNCLT